MKKFLFALILLPSLSLASGKISIEPKYLTSPGKWEGKVGLSIWEPIYGPLAFESWIGSGLDYSKGDYEKFVYGKVGFVLELPANLSVGLAGGVACNYNEKSCGPEVMGKVAYKIW
jgi:hypothetical protein